MKCIINILILILLFISLKTRAQVKDFNDSSRYKTYLDSGWMYFYIYEMNEAENMFKKSFHLNNSQEVYNEIILFYIKIYDLNKAEKWIKRNINDKGENYFNMGYKLILNILTDTVDVQNDKIYDEYTEKYGEYASIWLENTMESVYQ